MAYSALRFALCVLFFMLYLPFVTLAQTATATLSGTLLDSNGAVIPGVAITIENKGTTLKREVITNDAGYFTFPLLQPGHYTVTARRDGFAVVQVPDVVLNVGDQRSLEIQLKTGDVNAAVTVESGAELMRTDSSVGTIVDRQFAANIPLNGRSFQSLIALTPGVVTVPAGTTANTGGQFSVNGQRASANGFTVDGVSANFGASPGNFGGSQTSGNLPALTAFGTTQSLVSVDALEEFKVLTSSYAAEYGRQPGGQVSIVTRSGTNGFHGSVFDYLRNDVFDANDWFANANQQGKASEKQNDFGGTFSGPVFLPRFGEGGPGWYSGRDRMFFFFSYEGLRLRLPQFALTNVPSMALRQQAPAAMQPLLNAFPVPNGRELTDPVTHQVNGLAEFASNYTDPSNLNATSIRIDYAFGSKLTLFGRYNDAPSQSVVRRGQDSLSELSSNTLHPHGVTVGAAASLTSNMNNEVRFNYSSNGAFTKFQLDDFGGAVPPPRSVLIPSQYDVLESGTRGAITLSFPARTTTIAPGLSLFDRFESSQRQLNIVDNFSYIVASHVLKFGVDYRRLAPISASNLYLLVATFSSRNEVLAARAGTGAISTGIERRPVFLNISAYGQDTWRPTHRLTLDFGLRWELNPAPTEANGNDQAAVTQIDNLRTMQLAPLGTRIWHTTYTNFAPRVGLSYLVSQRSGYERVVRGGFGVFYDTGNDFSAVNFNSGFPYSSRKVVTNLTYPFSANQVAPLPLPIEAGIAPPYPIFNIFDPVLKLPYTLQWNVALEQALGKSQMVTVSFVGAAGRRLVQRTQLSLSTVNPNFTTVILSRNNASSDYDALQAQFQRRLSRGLQLLGSYTWSHTLDDDSTGSTGRVAQRGNADFDIRQLLAVAATYDIPRPGNNKLVQAILDRWSVDASVHAQSALPVDLIATTITDPATGELINGRPNVIPGVPFYVSGSQYPGGRTLNNVLYTVADNARLEAAGCLWVARPAGNTTAPIGPAKGAFCTPKTGQSGNLGRNQVRGLPAWQIDLALRREFRLGEKFKLQFRGEAFNILNHPNFGTIQTTLSAANFGQATNMLNRQLGGISQLYQIGGPRSLQLSLRLGF